MVVTFSFLSWLFGGGVGLVTAIAAIVAWWVLDPPRAMVWGLAAILLSATPIVLMIEGLPATEVVGAQFGLHHLAAHRVVVVALLVTAFAALIELFHLDRSGRHVVSES
jgi:hypothetical protein